MCEFPNEDPVRLFPMVLHFHFFHVSPLPALTRPKSAHCPNLGLDSLLSPFGMLCNAVT